MDPEGTKTPLNNQTETLITLNEKGNIRTKYAAPTYSGDNGFLLEDWLESLDAHFASAGTWTD